VIPRLIHQTSKSRDLPQACRRHVEKLKALHPDWRYCHWTDEDNLELIRTRMPELLETYLRLPKSIMRADVIRYVYMYKLGGLCVDTDYEMLRPFDLLQHEVVLPRETDEVPGEDEGRIANSLLASVPNHPFWKRVLDDLMANPPDAVGEVDVLSATGPMFLTRICHQACRDGLAIHTPAAIIFNPLTPRTTRAYQAIVNSKKSYGIHHCMGSWRSFGVRDRIKQGVWRALAKFV
jgi:mannosyltransferase OCH1-like enzyme